jgi:hypothetical protein
MIQYICLVFGGEDAGVMELDLVSQVDAVFFYGSLA